MDLRRRPSRPTARFWTTTYEGGVENDIFVSRDDGLTFTPTGLARPNVWWSSVRVAGDGKRIYATGYALEPTDGGVVNVPLLRVADDADSPTGPDLDRGSLRVRRSLAESSSWASPRPFPTCVFVRVIGDKQEILLRSDNGGMSFTEVKRMDVNLTTFIPFANGTTFLLGTPFRGDFISTDSGMHLDHDDRESRAAVWRAARGRRQVLRLWEQLGRESRT